MNKKLIFKIEEYEIGQDFECRFFTPYKLFKADNNQLTSEEILIEYIELIAKENGVIQDSKALPCSKLIDLHKQIISQIQSIDQIIDSYQPEISNQSALEQDLFLHIPSLQDDINTYNSLLTDSFKKQTTHDAHALILDRVLYEEIYLKSKSFSTQVFLKSLSAFLTANPNCTKIISHIQFQETTKNKEKKLLGVTIHYKKKSNTNRILKPGFVYKKVTLDSSRTSDIATRLSKIADQKDAKKEYYFEIKNYLKEVKKDPKKYVLRHIKSIENYYLVLCNQELSKKMIVFKQNLKQKKSTKVEEEQIKKLYKSYSKALRNKKRGLFLQ